MASLNRCRPHFVFILNYEPVIQSESWSSTGRSSSARLS
jgi:hypothetical protein